MLELATVAEVTLAIEPMHPACAIEWTFLTDLESTIEFIESFHSPHLKLVLDTYHFGNDEAVWRCLPEVARHTAVVHLGDRRLAHTLDQERCPLGDGKVPLADMVSQLQAAGYDGDFDVELMGQEILPGCYEQLLDDSRKQFERLTAPAGNVSQDIY